MRLFIGFYITVALCAAFTPHGLIPALLLFPLMFVLRVAEEAEPDIDLEYRLLSMWEES